MSRSSILLWLWMEMLFVPALFAFWDVVISSRFVSDAPVAVVIFVISFVESFWTQGKNESMHKDHRSTHPYT